MGYLLHHSLLFLLYTLLNVIYIVNAIYISKLKSKNLLLIIILFQ